ncbi:MAG: RNA 2',3'-cyclic phosphodiesterase, partial [Abditibacteriaceae bacterium]
MQPQRLFIAAHLPDNISPLLEQRQQSLRDYLGVAKDDLCWTPKTQFHLTLAFLGKVESTFLPTIIDTLETASKQIPLQTLHLGKCGLFCRRGVPTVLWCDVQTTEQLKHWCQKLRENLRSQCPDLDDKEFHPHLTLGRIKRGRSIDRCALKDLFEHTALCHGEPSWECKQVSLVKSE